MAEAEELINQALAVNIPLVNLIAFIVATWIAADYLTTHASQLDRLYQLAGENNYVWPRIELGECLSHNNKGSESIKDALTTLKSATGYSPLSFLFRTQEDWERALSALSSLGDAENEKPSKAGESRLVWLIHFKSGRVTPP